MFTLLGAVSAVAVYFLVDSIEPEDANFSLRVALAAAIATFSLAVALVTRRNNLTSGLLFALVMATVIAGISYWRLHIDWPHPFNFLALAVALFVYSPFYQASLHTQWRDYRALHHHAWSNAVILPLGMMFVGLAFAMAHLVAELFSLVGIDHLQKLLRQDTVKWLLGGSALGASIGALREHEGIIASTQRLVQSVFSLLTSPLALGLGGFLLVLPFTGLESLWNNTNNTSATLFACAFAALVFLNSVVREDSQNQSTNRFMQIAARVLALCLAPLALISALAVKLRIDQYGWTPDRLWAVVICILLVIYGIFYLYAALRKLVFNESVRQANILLALLVCAVALTLATPLFDFGKYSVKDQLARLEDGRVTEERFDLTAMAFDFGPAGHKALAELKNTASAEFTSRIENTLSAKTRYIARRNENDRESQNKGTLRVMAGVQTIPEGLLNRLQQDRTCKYGYCYLYWSKSGREVILVNRTCSSEWFGDCRPDVYLYKLQRGFWTSSNQSADITHLYDTLPSSEKPESKEAFLRQLDTAAEQGSIELRPVQRMQLYIDGVPVGPTME